MSGPSWLVDSKRIATKIKNASAVVDPSRVKWKSNPTKACPRCNHTIDNSDVVQEWPGLPGGVKFDPSDQELILHLLAKVGIGDAKPHPFISEFIPTVEEEDGICYTHPEKLPGCKRTGSLSHFFHRTFKAYNTGTRKRRKINTEDLGDVRWHKTGKTKPVIVDGKHLGCKKIMVLYMSTTKGGKPEKTNWVMHQYHLGTGEDEKDGEYVVSKIFYQQQSKPGDKNGQDLNMKMDNNFTELDPALGMKSFSPHKANKHDQVHEQIDPPQDRKDDECLASEIFYEQQSKPGDRIGPDLTVELDNAVTELDPAPDIKQDDVAIHEQSFGQGDKLDDQVDHPTEDAKWWEGESQYLLDSQQLAENIAICEEFLQSQSSCADGDAKKSCLLLSEYAHMSKEVLKRDLEECQKLDIAENANTEQDTPPDFRLSQLEFGSQESFSWACSKHID